MKKAKQASLGMNFLMNSILTMSSLIFPLITFPYVSRVLEADGLGKIQLATSVVNYFLLFSQLGLPTYGVRVCAVVRDDREKLSRTAHELVLINVIMTVISYGVFFAMVSGITKFAQERTMYLITSSTIFLNMIGMQWLFKALEQYTYITIRSVAFKFLSVIAMFLLVHKKEDYVIYSAITVLASAGSNLINLTQMRKYINLKPAGHLELKKHIRPLLVFFAMTCAATIYTNLDSVMLGFIATDEDVGYYSAAVKIKNILVCVISALGTVIMPRVSYYFERKMINEFWEVIAKVFRFVVIMATPLTLYFIFFARNGIYFLSGASYEPAVAPMVAIMPTLIFIGLTSVMGLQILVPMGRENVVLRSYIVGAVVDCIVNALLIPKMQALGAAIGTLVAEVCVFAVQYYALRKEVQGYFKSIGVSRLILSLGAALASSFWVARLQIADFWILVISAVIFFAVYAICLYFTKEPLLAEVVGMARTKLNKLLKK